ncbi:MAG TPA: TIM-barrel domain-containing protein, partial [Phototrophicaceae bacterium]|nr:TIM-barrel domain-containing protein [Phototrophicaceae bacterium]
MSVIPEQFKLEFMPVAATEASVQSGNTRFTVLTDRLIRMEYHPEGCFEDRPSQAFWFRKQPVPEFNVLTTDDGIEIETRYLHLKFTGEVERGTGFTPDNLSILIKDLNVVWHPGDTDSRNLHGTTRTLDYANGYTPLQPGLISRSGWSVIDDSKTLVFNVDSWLEPRISDGSDLYFFGYGHDYKACLRDYCQVSGKIPMIPRWILGNWWSRYWAYSQADLVSLIEDFENYELPFSVCILDMDWHITKTNNASTGWTGYTWNRELFPDPEAFIKFAHRKKLKIGLNLHPAEGIHSHEEQYETMARLTGLDPASGDPVVFNTTNPTFAKAYFDVLHRPYERMGVDFWWVDWQQGLESAIPGLDPLWLINHLHFYDQGSDGVRRPFLFSRWGNQGHQRYPIGFSGDSYITWDSLNFQSYMTATASNIAYGWWSHDIGGHTSGVEDRELFTRWVQFGVLSPINRIHVTKGFFYDRRPWMLDDTEALKVLREALQLRHALIPYIYSMAHRAHEDSQPLIEPMYYDYPDEEAAYHCPHQYLFGTELIAAPYVTPADPQTGLSRQVVWLPEGNWYHFFTGEHFVGNRWYPIYGKLSDIPLFAKAGAIIPLGPGINQDSVKNPEELHIHIFAGADGSFSLYEDDGETVNYLQRQCAETSFSQKWQKNQLNFTIDPVQGDTSLIPAQRTFYLHIHGIHTVGGLTIQAEGETVTVT